MLSTYPIPLLKNEIQQIYIDALFLTEFSAPNLKPYNFATEAITSAMAGSLCGQGFTVEPLDSHRFLSDADALEVSFCGLLCKADVLDDACALISAGCEFPGNDLAELTQMPGAGAA